MKTGIVRDPIYLEHLRGFAHVESPRRLEVLYDMLDRNFAGHLYPVSSRAAAPEELTRHPYPGSPPPSGGHGRKGP